MTNAILFIGDSITDAGRRDDPDGLGRGYVRIIAERRGTAFEVVNRGIGGDRIGDLDARWAEDALAIAPSILSVFVGINDTWRNYDDGRFTSPELFESTYRRLLTSSLDANPALRLILFEPFLLPINEAQTEWTEDLAGKQRAVATLATEFGATLVPLQSILEAAADGSGSGVALGNAEVAHDGVHPTPHGHNVIASAWLEVAGV